MHIEIAIRTLEGRKELDQEFVEEAIETAISYYRGTYRHEAKYDKPYKQKVVEENQPCRKCGTPVKLKIRQNEKVKAGQSYYFTQWLACLKCHTIYFDDKYKVII